MRINISFITTSFFAFLMLCLWFLMNAQHVHAATITWDGEGGDNNWSTAANWSGDTIPGASDDVVFDGTSTKDSTQDIVTKSILSISLNSGYTGTLTITQRLYVGTGGVNLNAGTIYNQNVFKVTNGTFTQTGGTFNADVNYYIELENSSNLVISGGTFSSNSDLLWSGTGTSSVDINSALTIGNWYQFYEADSDVVTVAAGDVITVNGDVDITGNSDLNCGAGAYFNLKYRLNLNNNTTTTGTCTIKFNGTSPQSLRSAATLNLPIEVNTTSTLEFYSTTGINDTFTITAGTLTHRAGMSVTVGASGTVTQNGGTWTGTESLTISGTYNLNGGTHSATSGTLLISSGGTLNVSGGTFSGNAGTLDVNGTLSLSSGTATLSSGNTNISGALTTSGGTLNHGSGTVVFDGTGASVDVNSSETLNAITINLTGGTDTITIASGDSLIAEGLVTTTNGKLSGKIEAQSNVSAGAGFDGGPGPIYFANSAVQTIDDGGNLPGLEINKTGGTLTINDGPSGVGTDADVLLTQGDVILPTGGSFWTEGSFTMNGGTLTCQGNSFFDIDESVTINGGTWTGGSTYSGSYSGPFTQTGGTFNVGTDGYEADSITISGGTFNAGSGSTGVKSYSSFEHSGGTFNADTSTVILSTATAATVTGDTTFYDFTCTVAGKSIEFGAGDTQTISHTLTLTGTDGNLISLRSSSPGTYWNLASTGTHSVSFVDVADSNASGGDRIMQTDSIDSGHNLNWDFYTPHAEVTSPVLDASLKIISVEKTTSKVVANVAISGKDIQDFALSETQYFEDSQWQNFEPTVSGDSVPTMFVDWSFSNPQADSFDLYGIFRSTTQVLSNPVSTSFTQADILSSEEPEVPVEDINEIVSGDYIQGETLPEIYFIDENSLGNLVRHTVFDLITFYTYQPTRTVIRRVADASVRLINFSKVQLYNPGVVLISFNSTDKVYVIAENSNDRYQPILFELTNEEYAVSVLGDNWQDYVIQVDDTLYPRFIFAGPVTSKAQIDRSRMKTLQQLQESVDQKK